jgi:hypothetical protein
MYPHHIVKDGILKPLRSTHYYYYQMEDVIFKVSKFSPFGCTILEPIGFSDDLYNLGEIKDISYIVQTVQRWLSKDGNIIDAFSEEEDEYEEILEKHVNYI